MRITYMPSIVQVRILPLVVALYLTFSKKTEDLHAQVKDVLLLMLADVDSDLIAGNTS